MTDNNTQKIKELLTRAVALLDHKEPECDSIYFRPDFSEYEYDVVCQYQNGEWYSDRCVLPKDETLSDYLCIRKGWGDSVAEAKNILAKAKALSDPITNTPQYCYRGANGECLIPVYEINKYGKLTAEIVANSPDRRAAILEEIGEQRLIWAIRVNAGDATAGKVAPKGGV